MEEHLVEGHLYGYYTSTDDIDNIEEWFKMGVSCVGVGSSLLGAGSLEDIENLAKEFKNKIAQIRG